MAEPAVRGPVRYLADHAPARYASLAGASGACAAFALRAARTSGARRLFWGALAALEAAIVIGILAYARPGRSAVG